MFEHPFPWVSAQYGHTIAVTSNGCQILTPWHLLNHKTAHSPTRKFQS
jgi:hypothetical protein